MSLMYIPIRSGLFSSFESMSSTPSNSSVEYASRLACLGPKICNSLSVLSIFATMLDPFVESDFLVLSVSLGNKFSLEDVLEFEI